MQARQQKAIELLHKFGYDDARVELESMKFEIERKQEGSQEEQEDKTRDRREMRMDSWRQ